MPRITPVSWKVLECIFLKAGFKFIGQQGSHRSYRKAGVKRPLVIPRHGKDIGVGVIKGLLSTAEMSRDEYFELLKKC